MKKGLISPSSHRVVDEFAGNDRRRGSPGTAGDPASSEPANPKPELAI